jgi:predicted alpha-1,6-mannanase (GH76 family)
LAPALHAQSAPFDACCDRNGRHISVQVYDAISWAAVATYRADSAVILWNAKALTSLSSPTQL